MSYIHTEIYGQGQPLVLIHGWSMHSGIWRPFAKQLAEHYRVICLDLPGHGRSDAVAPYTLAAIGEALLSVIPSEHFHVMGWSLGALVAIDIAKRCPERVDSVTMLAGNPCFVQDANWPGVKPEVLQMFADNLTVSCQATLLRFLALQVNGLDNGKVLLKQLKQAVQECDAPSVQVLQGGLELLRHSDLIEQLQSLECPVRAVLGAKDTLVPVRCGDKLRELRPDMQVKIVPDAGHVPFLSHADELIDFLLEAL